MATTNKTVENSRNNMFLKDDKKCIGNMSWLSNGCIERALFLRF